MPGRTVGGQAAAARKRRRPVDDHDADEAGDDTEIVDVQQASSSLRLDNRKRVRVSGEGPVKAEFGRPPRHDSPATESDDAAEEIETTEARIASPPATQYEKMRDDGFRHLQHEDEDDLRATQKLRSRPKLIGDNHAAENGILESITCINFMCHERLHCDLGPLLNFIVGENGSGKSAILTAITLCLGGKPSSTNRGGSLKSFIKEGRDQAILTVKIKNQGVDAYRHDIYGDSIIVERHFSKTGSSGFKIKPAFGNRVISTKRQEVEEIAEYYCMQVDNPLNVLSQDNARQFLNAASPNTKYRFFIQGVQLEQLDNDYRIVQESAELVESRVQDHEETVLNAKKSLDAATKLLELVKSNEEFRRKRRHYGNQLAWAQVADQEKILDQRKQEIAEFDRKILEAERAIETTSRDLEKEDERLRLAQVSVADAEEEEHEAKNGFDAANEVYLEAKKILESLHGDERDAHSRTKAAQKRINDLEIQVEAEEKRIQDVHGGAQAKKVRDLDEAKAALESVQSEIDAVEKAKPELIKAAARLGQDVAKNKEEIDAVRKDIGVAEREIETLSRSATSPYDGYEPRIPQLLEEIERNAASFDQKPIGPIGSHIQLLEPRWSSILETTLGRSLSSFIVTSKRDQVRLRGMFDRFRIMGSDIFIANKHHINPEGREPDGSFQTILRVLKIDNSAVRDQLIIHRGIEQIILIPERARAEEVMFNGPAPPNVQACLCFHDTRRNYGLRLAVKGSHSVSTSPVEPEENKRPRMKASLDSRVQARREALTELQSQLGRLNGERRTLEQAKQRAEAEVTKSEAKLKGLERKQRDREVAVGNINDELEEFNGAEGKLLAYKNELQMAKSEQEHHGNQYGELALKKQAKNKEVEGLMKKMKTEKKQVEERATRIKKASDKVQRCQSTRGIALTAKNEAYAEVEMLRQDKTRAEGKRDRQEATVAEFTEQATAVTPERVYIGEGETFASVTRKYEEVCRQIKEREDRAGMTDEQINDQFVAARKSYDECMRQSASAKAVCRELKNTLTQRLEKWRHFQRHISANSRVNFLYLLSERGFRGGLILDHLNRKLTLRVEPDETRKNASGRNTKTLSGGEKSFSSICLLLAIWEAMGSPLRCLDEFDVFMDNVNRAISTNMLITAARRSVSRQYILITPNAIEGSSHREKDVRIIRLVDPRQRTLTT